MLNELFTRATLQFLYALENNSGGFSNTLSAERLPQPTLSVLKSLALFGKTYNRPDELLDYIQSLYDPATGGFYDPVLRKVTVSSTAVALLILNQIGAKDFLYFCLFEALDFMHEHAFHREEHFMLICACNNCKAEYLPDKSIWYFRNQEESNGLFGPSALNNAICASALLMMGESLKRPHAVSDFILAAQTKTGGFADYTYAPDLWTSFCAMRLLDLMQIYPDRIRLINWLLNHKKETGGFSSDACEANANITYQCLSILHWVIQPVIDAAAAGQEPFLLAWLQSGGSPNVKNLSGWTPLLTSCAYGQAHIAKHLLQPKHSEFTAADPSIRYAPGDLSPILLAAQAGDQHLVQWLSEHFPDQNSFAEETYLTHSDDCSQPLTDELLEVLADGFKKVSTMDTNQITKINVLEEGMIHQIKLICSKDAFNINLRGGLLGQTPMIAAVTGIDVNPIVCLFRVNVVQFLVLHGADPTILEKRPMGVDAIYHAVIQNHFEILKLFSHHVRPLAFTRALNETAPINGQTALFDTVNKALATSDDLLRGKFIEQIHWCLSKGARIDIPDHSGITIEQFAHSAFHDKRYSKNAPLVIEALGLKITT